MCILSLVNCPFRIYAHSVMSLRAGNVDVGSYTRSTLIAVNGDGYMVSFLACVSEHPN